MPDQSGRCMGITEILRGLLRVRSFPPCVVEIPQTLQLTCAGATTADLVLLLLFHQVLCSSLFNFSTRTKSRPYRCLHMYSFMAVFGLQECNHPTLSLFFPFPFVWCDLSLSCNLVFSSLCFLFDSVFKDIFPIFVLNYVSHDQNK